MKDAFFLAGEIGFTIAIPIVALLLGGRLLDRTFGTAPWFLLGGVLLSLPVVGLLIFRKVRAMTQ